MREWDSSHRARSRRLASALAASVLLVCVPVHAVPQWNIGLVPAACVMGTESTAVDHVAFCGELHADLALGRERTRDWGFGPYLSLGTVAFDDLRIASGITVLIPMLEDFPIVASGGLLTNQAGELGIDAELFWGVRSYNFHSSYNLAAGLVLGVEQVFDSTNDRAISLGVQIDAIVLALPFILAWSALQ